MNTVLVISPHPDDEALGCGGTLRHHVLAGDNVKVLFLTSGENGGHGRPPSETMKLREREATQATGSLGFSDPEFWREADGDLKVHDNLIKRLIQRIETLQPTYLYVPHAREMHPDHRAAFRCTAQALSRVQSINELLVVRLYEVWTPIGKMDEIVDISEVIENKISAVRIYESQCSVLRFDEAVRGLNRYRGEMHSWPGGDYAEVFKLMNPQRG